MPHASATLTASTSQRLRVIFLLPSLAAGGSERVLLTVLRHVDRTRFDLTLAVVDGRRTDLAHDVPADIGFVDLGCTRVRHAPMRILKLLWRHRPSVVLSTLGHLNLMLAMLRPLLPPGVRIVGRESSVPSKLLALSGAGSHWHMAYRLLYPRLDLIVCQSRAMRDDLASTYGIRRDMRTISNPVDAERIKRLATDSPAHPFFDKDGVTRLVAIGRLQHEKGFDILLDALHELDRPDVRLAIVGDGALRSALEQQTKQLGLQSRVVFVGLQQNPYPWIRRADALVLPSRVEGFPNVALEALACGTPVVTAPVPGAVEILGSVQGCIVAPSGDPAGLAAALAQWLASPRHRLGADAVAPYDAPAITRRYEQVLDDAAVL